MIYSEILRLLDEYICEMECPICGGFWFFTFYPPYNMLGEIDEHLPGMCEFCVEEYCEELEIDNIYDNTYGNMY